MKAKQIVLVLALFTAVFSVNANSEIKKKGQGQQVVTLVTTFDGYDEDNGYSFLVEDEEEGDEEVMYFTEITDAALQSVNLKSDEFVGKRFEITYEITEYEEEDENGYIEVFETYTITKVKKV